MDGHHRARPRISRLAVRLAIGHDGRVRVVRCHLFYVFFELTLVPLFFLIGIWGGPQRQYAARKFFIYTLAGSLITLLGVLAIALVVAQIENEPTRSWPPHLLSPSPNWCKSRFAQSRSEEDVQQLRKLQRPGEFDLAAARAIGSIMAAACQLWVFVAMMCGFAIKVPMLPLHTWLPLAHVEAPTAGSVLLAGVLLKLGTYGFLPLCRSLPMPV